MKSTKRCDNCGKPIWDHDYISIYDPYMDAEVHIHGQCYEEEHEARSDAEVEAASRFFDTDFFS